VLAEDPFLGRAEAFDGRASTAASANSRIASGEE